MNIRPLFPTVTLIAALLMGGCAGNDKPDESQAPDWVAGQSVRYPNVTYLTGQGTGENLEAAKQQARAEVAKVFEVQVSEIARDVQIVEMENEVASSQSKAERRIDTQTREILSGVEIADIWQDPGSGRYYALAALNRDKSARIMREDIRHLDDVTGRNIEKARQETDRLRLASLAYNAYAAQVERALIQRKLRIIDPAGTGVAPPVELAKLKSDYEQVLGRIHIIAQSPDADVQDMVAAGLAQAGFNADPDRPTAYVLKASLETVPVIVRGNFYWQQAALNFQLQENTQGGKVRGADRWEIKVSATDEGLLEKRLKDELSRFNDARYRDMILGFAALETKSK